MDLSFSPDIDASLCYLVVLFFGLLSGWREVIAQPNIRDTFVIWGRPVTWLLFFIMMAAVFFFCKFMDQLALMLIAVPVYSPLIVHLGFDPIWFWMLFLINITVGGITPPFGYTMFVFKSAAPEVPLIEIYLAALPMVGIVTWLPNALR